MLLYNKNGISVYNDDCFSVLPTINSSIDLVLSDMPYAVTANKWDRVPDLSTLWEQLKSIGNNATVYVFTASNPFTSQLVCSNLEWFRYDWVWKKQSPTDFLNCNYKPLRIKEDIVVFSSSTVGSLSKNPIRYYPQGIVPVQKSKRNNPNSKWRIRKGYNGTGNILNSSSHYTQRYTNYPTNILEFGNDEERLHPTQKPVSLMEYLINTYTKVGDTVLDPFMGSGTTLVAAKNLGRKAIGIDISREYCDIAINRLEKIS